MTAGALLRRAMAAFGVFFAVGGFSATAIDGFDFDDPLAKYTQ